MTSITDMNDSELMHFISMSCAQVTTTAFDGSLLSLKFVATLLQLRGHEPPASIPLQDPNSGDVLCFNGEIFGGLPVAVGQNDGLVLLQALVESSGMKKYEQGCRGWHGRT